MSNDKNKRKKKGNKGLDKMTISGPQEFKHVMHLNGANLADPTQSDALIRQAIASNSTGLTKEQDEMRMRLINEFYTNSLSRSATAPRPKKDYPMANLPPGSSISLPRTIKVNNGGPLLKAPPLPPRTSILMKAKIHPHMPPQPHKKPKNKTDTKNDSKTDLKPESTEPKEEIKEEAKSTPTSPLPIKDNAKFKNNQYLLQDKKGKAKMIVPQEIKDKPLPNSPKISKDKKSKENKSLPNSPKLSKDKKCGNRSTDQIYGSREEKGDLVVALYDFTKTNSDEIDFKRGNYLRITDWDFEEDWVIGYLSSNPEIKGALPKSYIRKCCDLKKEQYIVKLKYLINNDNVNDDEIIGEDYYEWDIEDWNKLQDEEYSPEFTAGNRRWKILLCPKGEEDEDYVSIYLYCLDVEEDNFPQNGRVCVNFIFCIRNFNDYSSYNSKRSPNLDYFAKNNNGIGYTQFIKKSDLTIKNEKYSNPLIENGKTVIGAYIRVYNKGEESLLKTRRQAPKLTTTSLPSSTSDTINSAPALVDSNNVNPLEKQSSTPAAVATSSTQSQEDGDLVTVLFNFNGTPPKELQVQQGEYLRITNWDYEEEWAYGYKTGNKDKKGSIPKSYIRPCNERSNGEPNNIPNMIPGTALPPFKNDMFGYLKEPAIVMINEPSASNKNEPSQQQQPPFPINQYLQGGYICFIPQFQPIMQPPVPQHSHKTPQQSTENLSNNN